MQYNILPESIVAGYEGIVQPSGFLVPGKTKGQLQLYNTNVANPAETEINIASNDASLIKYMRLVTLLSLRFNIACRLLLPSCCVERYGW